MAQNKTFEVWSGLPTWAKGVIAVGGLAIVYFTTRSILRGIKEKKSAKDQKETVTTQEKELRNLLNTGTRLSYPDGQYNSWADAIKNQFEGCDSGQNIFSKDVPLIGYWSGSGNKMKDIVNQLKNNADFLKLVNAWGVRTYDQCGWGTGDVSGNLYNAVSDELDRGEIIALNNILKKKGITYQF